MCGRYTLTSDGNDIWDLIDASVPEAKKSLTKDLVAHELERPGRRRFNIVPTSYEPILRIKDGSPTLEYAHWWLLPFWGVDQVKWRVSKAGYKSFTWMGPPKSHFNSRWDTVTSPGNRYWNGLLNGKRCLIPADGFMEWPDDAMRPKSQDKIPHYFSLHEHRPFFFAGIYDEVQDDEGNQFLSYNIITVEPNEMLRRLPHHRMPAILSDDAVGKWLSPEVCAEEAKNLLKPTQDEWMVSYAISKLVNVPANESPLVLLPLEASGEPGTLF